MAKPNYSFEKRQRELAKKKKQEEKRQRKTTHKPDGTPVDDEPAEPGSVAVPPAGPSKTA